MATPYLYERQTEYWTSRGIEDYFLDARYEVVVFPLSQLSEKELPLDFLFLDQTHSKLFGVQYKALYHNERDFWPLNERQHAKLRAYRDWAYYGLSEMTSVDDQRVAIQRTLFVPVSIDYESKLYKGQLESHYYRWGGFLNGLERCSVGLRVKNRGDLEQAVRPLQRDYIEEIDRDLLDLFVVNLRNRRMVHLDGRR